MPGYEMLVRVAEGSAGACGTTANNELVSKLLRAGADGGVGWRGCHDKTLLHAAAKGGDALVVSLLQRAGARADFEAEAPGTGHTPLHLAVLGGNAATAKALTMAEADVNVLDAMNGGPLHLAIREGQAGIAKDLLLSEADASLVGSTGESPIDLAVDSGQDDIVVALAHKGVDLEGVAEPPLLRAVRQDHISTVRVLLAVGANANNPFSDYDYGTTVLHFAAETDNAVAIPVLIEAGASVQSSDMYDGTPLHSAATHGSCTAMRALLQLGADIDAKCGTGSTALHAACRQGEADAADLLLRWGAKETAVDLQGSTPSEFIPAIAEAADEDHRRLERLSKLLTRAPQDRAWRRRGFLALCRAHPDRLRLVVEIPKTADEASGKQPQEQERPSRRARKGQQSKVDVEVDDAHGSVSGEGSSRAGIVRVDGKGDGGGFEFAAGWLVALAEEDVFRKIVGFL
ncbi:unnamed protein product [Ectocarpus sp. CCAP 1310/34]|nr:unnamed protein product [Ectocarpus sp. CCAP 1310/34]